jgi:hypothetical protein
MITMKYTLLIASTALALTACGRVAEKDTGPAAACTSSCKSNADYCREQCAHPEEPEQCIVACSSAECNDSCNKFEEACKRHCLPPNKG